MMEIRPTEIKDLPLVMEIYDMPVPLCVQQGTRPNGLTAIRRKH